MTFLEAKALFNTARNKSAGKPLELNTRLIKLSEDCYGILLYNTVVVEIWEGNCYKIKSGGWKTQTTRKRITRYSPVTVYSRKKVWFVNQEGESKLFQEGMRVY